MFAIGYQMLFAYCVSFVVYNLISLFTGAITSAWGYVGVVLALAVIAFAVFMVIRPDKKKEG